MDYRGKDLLGNIQIAPVRPRSFWGKLQHSVQDELRGFQARLQIIDMLLAPIPLQVGGRLRAAALRMIGFRIGSETVIHGQPRMTGSGDIYGRLIIGHQCQIGIDCTFDLEDQITIGDRVTIGHQTLILTSSHAIGSKECRAGAVTRTPVTIGDGAWIGPRCIILPGMTIGAGAVVAAGALVNRSVRSNTCVSGSPAHEVEVYRDDFALDT